MEAPQQRRRRPAATYGKPVRKRFSDFGEIFSPVASPKAREELPEDQRTTSTGATKVIRASSTKTLVTTTAKMAKAQGNPEKENQTINIPPSANSGEANLSTKATEKKGQMTSKGKNKRPSPASAVTSPPKHHKVFDFNLSDDELIQPQTTTWHPKGGDEFDVPSSDEEHITVQKKVPPRRPSRAPGAPTSMKKFAKEIKPGVADLSTRDSKLVRNDPPPKKQGKQGKQVPTSKNITATSKVVKPPSSKPSKILKTSEAPKAKSSKASKALKTSSTAPPGLEQTAANPSTTLFTVDIVKSVPQKPCATRPESRQPPVEPEVLGGQYLDQTAPRTKSTQTKPLVGSNNEPTMPHKPTLPKRIRRVASVPLPIILDGSPCPKTPPSPQRSPQLARRNSTPYSSGILPQVDGLSNNNQLSAESKGLKRSRGTVPRISEILVEESAPRRRRLIDRLGAGAPQPDMMDLFSSDSSDDYSEEENSQSQNIYDSQIVDTIMDRQPQELVTESLVKPIYSNGRIGPKVTYARQRSFRTEDLDGNALFNTPLIMAQQQRNTALEEDEGLEGDTGSKMMKSIHELREAGVNNRFLDDIEELFGDIEGDTSLGRQRSGYLEFASKMRDKAFVGKFRANNLSERLLTNLNKKTDEIICFSLSFILCCLLREDTTVQTVSQIRSNGSLQMLVRMLDFEKDIYVTAKDRKTNMSKAAQGLVQDLRTKVEKSPAFADRKPKVLSSQIMALKVLEEFVRELREAGVRDDFLPTGGLKKLVQIMKPFSKNTTKATDTLPLQLTVSILESYTIGSRAPPEQQLSETELKVVAELLPAVIGVKTKDMTDILLLILRLDINLTNNRSSICDIFTGPSHSLPLTETLVYMVHDKFNDLAGMMLDTEERTVQLDLLVLSLGLLINFAELSDKARYSVAGREMILLDLLLRIFLERLERIAEADSFEESQSNVAFGYLSILLGNMCQNISIQERIRLKMPKATLTPLIGSLEEFIAHHRKVDDQYEGYDGGPNAAFTERLEQVVKKLKEGSK